MMGYKTTKYDNYIEIRLNEFWIAMPIEQIENDFIIESIVKKINEMIVADLNIRNSKFYKLIKNTEYGKYGDKNNEKL